MSESVIFFGNEQLAQGIKASTPIFDALSANYSVCALILPTEHTRKPFPIALAAQKQDIPVFYTKDTTEILDIIAKYQPTLGVLAAYSKFIPDRIIEAIPGGIINIHPSLLPLGRGTTPIESVLLNDDKQTGVSIMRLVKAMDAGPVLAQASVDITDETTKQSLYESLSTLGAQLLLEVMPRAIKNDRSEETLQDDTQASFTTPLSKELSQLTPESKTARQLQREIVAFAGFPKSKYTFAGKLCTITNAHVASAANTQLDLKCQDGNYLVIDQLIPENSKPMDAKAFLNGLH